MRSMVMSFLYNLRDLTYPLFLKISFRPFSALTKTQKKFLKTSHHLLHHVVALGLRFLLFGQNFKITLRPEIYAKLHLFKKNLYLPSGYSGAIIVQGFTFVRVLLTISGLPYGGSVF